MSWSSPSDVGFEAATLVLLSCANLRETDAKLARLAEKWGIRAVFVDSGGAPLDIVNHIGQQERICLAASAASLGRLFREQSALCSLSSFPPFRPRGYGSDGFARDQRGVVVADRKRATRNRRASRLGTGGLVFC